MHLRPCSAPVGPLTPAPLTALWRGPATERVAGFWGADDVYYLRRQRAEAAGAEWYRVADGGGEPAEAREGAEAPAVGGAGARARLVIGGRAARRLRGDERLDPRQGQALRDLADLQRLRASYAAFAWVGRRRPRV